MRRGERHAQRRPGGFARKWSTLGAAASASLACCAWPVTTSADASDRIAAKAYVTAVYAYTQATAANAPGALAAAEATASRIGGECGGILAAAPDSQAQSVGEFPPFLPRQRNGQAVKAALRLGRARQEIDLGLSAAYQSVDRSAAVELAAKLKAIHWDDRRVSQVAAAFATYLEAQAAATAPAVCSDFRAWAKGGFGALPPSSKQALKSRQTLAEQAVVSFGVDYLIAKYEGPSERAIARATLRLERRGSASGEALGAVVERAERQLGLAPRLSLVPSRSHEAQTRIASGRTAAGTKFEASLESKKSSSQVGCGLELNVEEGSGGGSDECLTRSGRPAFPSVNCQSGLLTVTANTLPGARVGRLKLSDGTVVSSRLLFVSRKLGGPATFYYQAVRGPSPVPVSLAEVDGHGKVLHVLMLPRVVECTKHPVKVLPGGLRTIVRDRVPGGARFSIVGERTRFLGNVEFKLHVRVQATGATGSSASFAVGGGSSSAGATQNPFTWQTEEGCDPHPYVIVFGVLSQPRDVALVAAAGRLYPLRRVALPASLHQQGALAYAALRAEPTKLIVRAPNGRTVLAQNTGGMGLGAEACESEEERES
jgi:hypothetical protein